MKKKTHYRKWSDWEIRYIRYAYEENISEEIMELVVGRTVNAIRKFTLKEQLRYPNYRHKRIKWIEEEEKIILENIEKDNNFFKAHLPHRSLDSIRSKIYKIDKYV